MQGSDPKPFDISIETVHSSGESGNNGLESLTLGGKKNKILLKVRLIESSHTIDEQNGRISLSRKSGELNSEFDSYLDLFAGREGSEI